MFGMWKHLPAILHELQGLTPKVAIVALGVIAIAILCTAAAFIHLIG